MTEPHALAGIDEMYPGVWKARCSCDKAAVGSDKDAVAKRIQTHAEQKNSQPTCPTPDKRRFKSKYNAERDLARLWVVAAGKPSARRAYLCVCGRWHHTSKVRGGRISAGR